MLPIQVITALDTYRAEDAAAETYEEKISAWEEFTWAIEKHLPRDENGEFKGLERITSGMDRGDDNSYWSRFVYFLAPKEWPAEVAEEAAMLATRFYVFDEGTGGRFARMPYAKAQNGRVLVKQTGGRDC